MNAVTHHNSLADVYFGFLSHLNADSKLDLISRLSLSLKGEENPSAEVPLQSLFGAYQSEESAEQIIAAIRASRVSSRNIEPL